MKSRVLRIVFLVLGLIMVTVGLLLILVFPGKREDKIKRYTGKTKARVVKNELEYDSSGDMYYRVTVEFTIDGRKYVETRPFDTSRKGRKYTVKYDPDRPSDHYIAGFDDTPEEMKLHGLFVLLFGSGFLIADIVYLIMSKRRK